MQEEYFDYEYIVKARYVYPEGGGRLGWQYCVKWTGYPDSQNTWEHEEHFQEHEGIDEFWERSEDPNLRYSSGVEEGRIICIKALPKAKSINSSTSREPAGVKQASGEKNAASQSSSSQASVILHSSRSAGSGSPQTELKLKELDAPKSPSEPKNKRHSPREIPFPPSAASPVQGDRAFRPIGVKAQFGTPKLYVPQKAATILPGRIPRHPPGYKKPESTSSLLTSDKDGNVLFKKGRYLRPQIEPECDPSPQVVAKESCEPCIGNVGEAAVSKDSNSAWEDTGEKSLEVPVVSGWGVQQAISSWGNGPDFSEPSQASKPLEGQQAMSDLNPGAIQDLQAGPLPSAGCDGWGSASKHSSQNASSGWSTSPKSSGQATSNGQCVASKSSNRATSDGWGTTVTSTNPNGWGEISNTSTGWGEQAQTSGWGTVLEAPTNQMYGARSSAKEPSPLFSEFQIQKAHSTTERERTKSLSQWGETPGSKDHRPTSFADRRARPQSEFPQKNGHGPPPRNQWRRGHLPDQKEEFWKLNNQQHNNRRSPPRNDWHEVAQGMQIDTGQYKPDNAVDRATADITNWLCSDDNETGVDKTPKSGTNKLTDLTEAEKLLYAGRYILRDEICQATLQKMSLDDVARSILGEWYQFLDA